MVLSFSIFYVVIAGIKEKYDEAMKRSDVKAIVITGKFKWLFGIVAIINIE